MNNSEGKESQIGRREIYLPMSTILRLLLVILFICCIKILAPLLMTLFLACLLAVSLEPVILWLEQKRLKRLFAIALVTIVLAGIIMTLIAIVVPSLFAEFSNFIANFPKLKEQILESLSRTNPFRPFIEHGLSTQNVIPNSAF